MQNPDTTGLTGPPATALVVDVNSYARSMYSVTDQTMLGLSHQGDTVPGPQLQPTIQTNPLVAQTLTPVPAHNMAAYVQGPLPGYMVTSQVSNAGALHIYPAAPHRAQPVVTTQPTVPLVHQPPTAPSTGTLVTGQQTAQQFQRLKVEDALYYLDQVKLQFGNHPQVYNDFLDIMKEFKSQTIDTPGVISRVSNLFKGHPDLIVGFNTFLPPGYKIEVQANDTISVQQPGQPSMTLSQLSGARDSLVQQYRPVNLSVNSSSTHLETTRSSVDNMLAASAAAAGGSTGAPGQPVEFNHAINYVNKIKNRFQGQPDIYKNFLDILHTYQKEQRQIKEKEAQQIKAGLNPTASKPLTETEVYAQVAKLFHNQEDLLREFGQFLPDANGPPSWGVKSEPFAREHAPVKKPTLLGSSSKPPGKISGTGSAVRKPPPSITGQPPPKKSKSVSTTSAFKDVTLAEAGKYGTLTEFALFDKVRKALRSQEVYENFLRCLHLFNQEVVSREDLTQLVHPFLSTFPELFRWFKDLLGIPAKMDMAGATVEAVSARALDGTNPERIVRDEQLAMEIDYSSCKRYGHSYRGLPKTYHPPRCSGRTALCKEVLNDTWVSFPSWSEESTFVTSRKTQFEENIYRCEDERFELDMVIEMNLVTIRALEGVQKKMQRMSAEDAAKYKLDNNLGGTSEVIHRKAIHRIYGDKAVDMIDGLRKNPIVAVPLVLRRLKAKDEEWREAQKQFNKIWREQNEKFYLKSLDHQGINFKQNDTKTLRSKSLLNEIEAIYDTAQKANRDAQSTNCADEPPLSNALSAEGDKRPHMVLPYRDPSLVDDALGLILHHVRRQISTQKEEKQKMKATMKQGVQLLFHRDVVPLSDDEEDEVSDETKDDSESSKQSSIGEKSSPRLRRVKEAATTSSQQPPKGEQTDPMKGEACEGALKPVTSIDGKDGDYYSLICANNNWYFFLRLHHILATRLSKIKGECERLKVEHERCKRDKSESTAVALRLKAASDVEPEQYYNTFLELIKSLLDGNIESSYYEDQLREMFGIHAYIAFTLDKVVQNIVKQLQYIVTDDLAVEVTYIWMREQSNGATGGALSTRHQRVAAELNYQKQVESLLSEENCFQILVHKRELTMEITLLDNDQETSSAGDSTPGQADKWSEYVDRFVGGAVDLDLSDEVKQHLKHTPIFLTRNLKRWKKYNHSMLERQTARKRAIRARSDDEAAEPYNDHDGGDDDEDDEDDDNDNVRGRTERIHHLSMLEGTQCRFNINSFKMVYVVNSESYLYKRNALTKARQTHQRVTSSMYLSWHRFCKTWLDSNTSSADIGHVQDWLEGKSLEDCRPCHTTCLQDNKLSLTPYRLFSRYVVRYERVTPLSTAATDDGSLTALIGDDVMDTM